MNPSCQEFRSEWLSAGPSADGHASACPTCAAWVRACERSQVALNGLTRLVAPPELEARVSEELSGAGSPRIQRLLESAVRRTAPKALDLRVQELVEGATGTTGHKAEALRALDVRSAPPVLERLIEEELAAPALHRAERFTGNLERLQAPEVLGRRVGESMRRNALMRLVLGPLLTLAAAGLVLWLTAQREDGEREYRFRVTRASSLAGLDPMARALAESLGGNAGMAGMEGTPR